MYPRSLLAAIAIASTLAPLQAQTPQTRPAVPQDQVPLAPAAEELKIPTSERWLGTVRVPMRVLADGKLLSAGRYRVRLTGEAAQQDVVGQLEALERWVEFLQGNEVKGRVMAPVVPAAAIKQVTSARPPAQGRFRVERLKEDHYLRLWYNLGGDQILIYLPIAAATSAVPAR